MVELLLEKATDFKRSIDAIAALINEAEFIIDPDALSLKATDPSQISLVDFRLPKSAFKRYDVKAQEKLGLDLVHLRDIMSRCKASDSLEMSLVKGKPNLELTFKGAATRNFLVPLLDVSTAELPTPKIEFDAHVKITAEVLQDALKDAALLSNHITLGITADSFFAKASSTKGSLKNVIAKSDKALLELKASKECAAMFPLDYLQSMLKGASSDTEVMLSLKNDAPIKISYRVAGAELTYFLAPRIESA